MNIRRDVRVETPDGQIGRVKHVIVDPQTREVTDLVVRHDGADWMVPIGAVATVEGDHVRLRAGQRPFHLMQSFSRDQFHEVDEDEAIEESEEQAEHGGAPLLDANDDAVQVGRLPGAAAPAGHAAEAYGPIGDPDNPYRLQPTLERPRTAWAPGYAAPAAAIVPDPTTDRIAWTPGADGGGALGGALIEGVPVVTSDGEPLGTVGEVAADRFKVNAPMARDYWLPASAITGTAPGGDVIVKYGKEQLEGAKTPGPDDEDLPDTGHLRARDPGRMQLREERLQLSKHDAQTGAVRLSKRIVEHVETVEVPVTEEWLVVERVPGAGRVVIDGRELGEGEYCEFPLRVERVQVTKEVVATEDILVYKQVAEHTEQVRETVRKEELVVDDPHGYVVDSGGRTATPEAPVADGGHATVSPRVTATRADDARGDRRP